MPPRFLDQAAPLNRGSHREACGYRVDNGKLVVCLADNSQTMPADPAVFAGYRGDPEAPEAVLFVHHGLHLEM